MKKTILIPTDFTIESLNVLKTFLNNADKECKYDIILLHGAFLNDSITDLLYFSKRKQIKNFSNSQFDEAFLVIKNKHESMINSIRKEVFFGLNQNAFNNFVEGNKIEEAYIPAHRMMHLRNKKSFDLIPYVLKSGIKVHEISTYVEAPIPEKGKVAEVFFNGVTSNI